uniref:Nibrin n=1 Tax=Phallusia mammillata TaxID=59560 RepID=A0A6F9DMK4_9ASCI|nr:nibrin [Phallusia mammillata]
MFILKSADDVSANIVVKILPEKVYICGRKNADINIPNDSSVSRKHCTVQLTANGKGLLVKDSSKYGTFFAKDVKTGTDVHKIEYTRINEKVELSGKDVLRIGVLKSVFHVQSNDTKSPVVVHSKLGRSAQVELEKYVKKLNGKVVKTWSDDITHLAMKEVVLNVKVTQALASNTPIVTCEFFKALAEASESSNEVNLPVCNDFVPEIADEGLNKNECSFAQNVNRSKLFDDKTIVFLSDVQFNRLGNTCSLAGASVLLANDSKFNFSIISNDNTIVVSLSPETNGLLKENLFERLQETMIESSSRFIQEFEIGLALLYCSTEMYCNPKFDLPPDGTFTSATLSQLPGTSVCMSQNVTGPQSTTSLSMSRVPETADIDITETDVISSTKDVVKETVQSSSRKRALDSDTRASKVPKRSSDDENVLLDLNQTKKKPKPAPKRKQSVIKPADMQRDDTMLSKVQSESPHKKSSKTKQVVEISDNELDDLPDSCIADDSLWTDTTSAAQSLKLYEEKDDDLPSKPESVTTSSSHYKPKDQHKVTEVPQTPVEMQGSNFMPQVIKQEAVDDSTIPGTGVKPMSSVVNSQIGEKFGSQVHIKSDSITFDADLPYKDLMKVVHVSLVVGPRKKKSSSVDNGSGIKNFKKFRKVFPTYYNSGSQTNTVQSMEPPKIIGGRDLFAHNNRIENDHVIDDWAFPQSQPESQSSQDRLNPFKRLKK